jgi:hypothetical protein
MLTRKASISALLFRRAYLSKGISWKGSTTATTKLWAVVAICSASIVYSSFLFLRAQRSAFGKPVPDRKLQSLIFFEKHLLCPIHDAITTSSACILKSTLLADFPAFVN